jgi:hypothetical protein
MKLETHKCQDAHHRLYLTIGDVNFVVWDGSEHSCNNMKKLFDEKIMEYADGKRKKPDD